MSANEQSKMGRHMLVVTTGILLSKCLGLARDVVFAYVWGTGTALAAFILAFTIPNLLRALLGEGAFNAAFVPMLNEKLGVGKKQEAREMASRVFSVVALVLVGIVIVLTILALVGRAVAPNELARLTFEMLPWVLPYAILICLAAGLASILNSVGKFAVPAFSPTVLNICFIAAALGLAPLVADGEYMGVFALVLAVPAAGLLQMLINWGAVLKEGWNLRFRPAWKEPAVQRFGRLLAPIMVGAGVVQLNVVVDKLLAGYLGSVATTTLYYSQRLVYLPVGLFGVAMSTVCLPAMSRAWARNDRGEIARSLRFSLNQVLFLAIPSAVGLAVLRAPIIRLLFERGTFGPDATAETAWTLLFYLIGIPAFVAAKVATTPYHARQDTKTPVKIAGACLALNVVLNLVLMQFLRQGGLALATSICSWVNVSLLLLLAGRSVGNIQFSKLIMPTGKVLLAATAAGVVMHYTLGIATAFKLTGLGGKMMDVLLPLTAGGVTYLAATFLTGCGQLRQTFREKYLAGF